MIKKISKNQLDAMHKKLPINYDEYISWLDDELDQSDIYYLSTSLVQVREKDKWNSEGREIFDVKLLKIHSNAVAKMIENISCSKFLVEHEYRNWVWLPEKIIMGKNVDVMVDYFKKKLPNVDPKKFYGGIYIEDELSDFITAFIDYPFTLKYRDIDCLSTEKKVIVKITHHLTVDFVTWDKRLLDQIDAIGRELGLQVTIS